MTTEKLKIANELNNKIKHLQDHIPAIESDLGKLLGVPRLTESYVIELPHTHSVKSFLFSEFLPLPQDPKALLELYLTNARAELGRLQTEFDNL